MKVAVSVTLRKRKALNLVLGWRRCTSDLGIKIMVQVVFLKKVICEEKVKITVDLFPRAVRIQEYFHNGNSSKNLKPSEISSIRVCIIWWKRCWSVYKKWLDLTSNLWSFFLGIIMLITNDVYHSDFRQEFQIINNFRRHLNWTA